MSSSAQTTTTTTTSPAVVATAAQPKSAKQRKREAADAKLATATRPVYAGGVGPAPSDRKPAPPVREAASDTQEAAPKASGHNSNKGQKIAMNTVGPKRELAYAVVGLLADIERLQGKLADYDGLAAEDARSTPNVTEARAALAKHGYENLRPRAERIESLKADLQVAAANGDLPRVTELAKQMKAVQDGRAD